MVGLTSRKMERTKLESKIYINVGIRTVTNFKHMVSTNMMWNFPVLVAYIISYEKMYWPSMASLKFNSTRIKPSPVIKNKNNSKIELCIDTAYINGVSFMVYIDRNLNTDQLFTSHLRMRKFFLMYWPNTPQVKFVRIHRHYH